LMRSVRAFYSCEAYLQKKPDLCKVLGRKPGWVAQDTRLVNDCMDLHNYYSLAQLNISGRPDGKRLCETLPLSALDLDSSGAGGNPQEACVELMAKPGAYCKERLKGQWVPEKDDELIEGCVVLSIRHGDGSVCSQFKGDFENWELLTDRQEWCFATAAYRKAYYGKDVELCGDSKGCRMLMGENICSDFLYASLRESCLAGTEEKQKTLMSAMKADREAARRQGSKVRKKISRQRARLEKEFSKLEEALNRFDAEGSASYISRRDSFESLRRGFYKFMDVAMKKSPLIEAVAKQEVLKTMARVQDASREISLEWISIPGGDFMMGTGEGKKAPRQRAWKRYTRKGRADEGFRRAVVASDEYPRHKVTVPAFQMAKSEVTKKQYQACVDTGLCTPPHCDWPPAPGQENTPVVCVYWHQAKEFSEWVGGRLPTEAEWEYAARSGGRDWEYPWGNDEATCERAVTAGCSSFYLPVCSKPAGNTAQGLCDMSGNAWEWTQDWYKDSYHGAPTDGSAWEIEPAWTGFETPKSKDRVFRGGCWSFSAKHARAANRDDHVPGGRYGDIGFRPVRPIP
jgi:formylglycine-generating enzyme required for sulfatase activity